MVEIQAGNRAVLKGDPHRVGGPLDILDWLNLEHHVCCCQHGDAPFRMGVNARHVAFGPVAARTPPSARERTRSPLPADQARSESRFHPPPEGVSVHVATRKRPHPTATHRSTREQFEVRGSGFGSAATPRFQPPMPAPRRPTRRGSMAPSFLNSLRLSYPRIGLRTSSFWLASGTVSTMAFCARSWPSPTSGNRSFTLKSAPRGKVSPNRLTCSCRNQRVED